MTAHFAAIETATATSAVAALANVTATIDGQAVDGVFDAAYAEAFGLASGSAPVFLCASADISTVAEGTAITINATAYTVAEIKPDGTGMTLLILESA